MIPIKGTVKVNGEPCDALGVYEDGSIAFIRDNGRYGDKVDSIAGWGAEELTLERQIIPAQPGWWVQTARVEKDGTVSRHDLPVVAWGLPAAWRWSGGEPVVLDHDGNGEGHMEAFRVSELSLSTNEVFAGYFYDPARGWEQEDALEDDWVRERVRAKRAEIERRAAERKAAEAAKDGAR